MAQQEYAKEFETLWELYPKQIGKENALNSYIKARGSGTSFEEVEQGIKNYNANIRYKNIPFQYIKNGSTYFYQNAWRDNNTAPSIERETDKLTAFSDNNYTDLERMERLSRGITDEKYKILKKTKDFPKEERQKILKGIFGWR